jgi:hypothetical protein
MTRQASIPVSFVPAHLAVNESQVFEILGLNDGRSDAAKKKAFKKFRDLHDIKALPGFVFSLRKIQKAIEEE